MTCAVLITPLVDVVPKIENCDYIGVDAGALKIIDQGFPIKMAVGDFDSLSEEDFKRITCPIERHPIMKDETDSELAIRLCKDYDTIYLYGAMQGRIDHTIANIRLAMYRFQNVVLIDEHQKISVMNVGIHEIDDSYHHISFYPIQEGVLSLSGFLYPLDKRRIHIEEIYTTSNSLTEKKGIVRVDDVHRHVRRDVRVVHGVRHPPRLPPAPQPRKRTPRELSHVGIPVAHLTRRAADGHRAADHSVHARVPFDARVRPAVVDRAGGDLLVAQRAHKPMIRQQP